MAIYHLSLKNGSVGGAAPHGAYIQREGKYAAKDDLVASESGNLPAWSTHDPGVFWSAADAHERANGRPYRELEIALPRELDSTQQVELVREFVGNVLGKSHAYTWAIHSPSASDGEAQPHVHLMFSERKLDGISRDPEQYFQRFNRANPALGGAGKDRYFNSQSFVWEVRQEWAQTANHYLERAGFDVRIDARSYREQGLSLEPQVKRGIEFHGETRGVLSAITEENRARAARNGERLLAQPELAIESLTHHQSVFSERALQQFVFRNTDGQGQFEAVMLKVRQSPELVGLERVSGRPSNEEWLTSRALQTAEARLVSTAGALSNAMVSPVDSEVLKQVSADRTFTPEQAQALSILTGERQLASVNGAAGTGKSYVLSAVRQAYEKDGFRVIGAALQGKTAEDLERDSGIESSTLHRLMHRVEQGFEKLDDRTVLVIDEAGLVGSKQLDQVLGHAAESGARVRVVGDTYQLNAVAAGDAFSAVTKQTSQAGATARLTQIQRQGVPWQREASMHLSEHRIGQSLDAYATRGFVQESDGQGQAIDALLGQWNADRLQYPEQTQLIVTHTNRDRKLLNESVRAIRREAGELGSDRPVQTATGRVSMAEGDRLVFTRNDPGLGVKNGSLGVIEGFQDGQLSVRLDRGGETIQVDPKSYDHIDHGYALTVHKAQGDTVDRGYVLASPMMDARLTYVAMTRHREAVQVHYGRDQFAGYADLKDQLSRVNQKSFTADYVVRALPEIEAGSDSDLGKRQTIADRNSERDARWAKLEAATQARLEKAREKAQPQAQQQKDRLSPAQRAGVNGWLADLKGKGLQAVEDAVSSTLRSPVMTGRVDDHPDMKETLDALKALEGSFRQAEHASSWASTQIERFKEDHPKRALMHSIRALQAGELAKLEKEIRAAEKTMKDLKEPMDKAQSAVDQQRAVVGKTIEKDRPVYEEAIRAGRALAGQMKAESNRKIALVTEAHRRQGREPGYRDEDAHWRSIPEPARQLIDAYSQAKHSSEREQLSQQAEKLEGMRDYGQALQKTQQIERELSR